MRAFSTSLIILSFCSIFYARLSQAQATSSTSALQLIRSQKKPVVIDSLSLSRYESAFIPALADSIAEQDLVITAQASAPADFKFDHEWLNLALKGGTRTLLQNSALPNKGKLRGPAFATFEQIQEKEDDPSNQARKLIWNVVAAQESNRFLDLRMNFSWTIQNRINPTIIRTRLVTVYPGTIQPEQSVSLREKLEVSEPEWLSAFQLLTLRQYGKNDDLLWIFSPSLLSTRELSGSLRSDRLFESLFSLDDLLIFSNKPELLEPILSASFETLVPFIADKASGSLSASKDPNCQDFSNSSEDNSNPFSSIYFAPRKVFALELKQRDPYSQIGRQKLYVDSATMLPFFKEVYSQDGKLNKSVLGVYNMFNEVSTDASSEMQETHFVPYNIFAFGKAAEVSVLKTKNGRICSQIPKDIPAKFFDPSSLGASQPPLNKEQNDKDKKIKAASSPLKK